MQEKRRSRRREESGEERNQEKIKSRRREESEEYKKQNRRSGRREYAVGCFTINPLIKFYKLYPLRTKVSKWCLEGPQRHCF